MLRHIGMHSCEIAAVGKQYVLHILSVCMCMCVCVGGGVRGVCVCVVCVCVRGVCVCSLSYPACKAHALCFIFICGLSGSTVFLSIMP